MRGYHISLFSGVAMTDLAVERAGFKTIATAEVDQFCRMLLQKRLPDAVHYDDVRAVSARGLGALLPGGWLRKRPLLMSGGFPCQDVSSSGTGEGLGGARSGLWGEFARCIGEFKPDYVLIENSPLLLSRGLNVVLRDLARMGYSARWDCFPAAAFGAPHLRDRIYIVASRSLMEFPGGEVLCDVLLNFRVPAKLPRAGAMRDGLVMATEPQYPTNGLRKQTRWPTPTRADGSGGPGTTPKRTGGKNLRTAVAEVEGNGRLNPAWVEWLMGVPAGWSDPRVPNDQLQAHPGWQHEPVVRRTADHRQQFRSERIRALGNGLVPAAASAALDMLELS